MTELVTGRRAHPFPRLPQAIGPLAERAGVCLFVFSGPDRTESLPWVKRHASRTVVDDPAAVVEVSAPWCRSTVSR